MIRTHNSLHNCNQSVSHHCNYDEADDNEIIDLEVTFSEDYVLDTEVEGDKIDLDSDFIDLIMSGGGEGGGVQVYSSKADLPQQGNKSFLYIIRGYGTFYWDVLAKRYEPIPIYSGDIEKIFITADGYRILTQDNYIFKPIM